MLRRIEGGDGAKHGDKGARKDRDGASGQDGTVDGKADVSSQDTVWERVADDKDGERSISRDANEQNCHVTDGQDGHFPCSKVDAHGGLLV
jgi:hypothetical protein